MTPAFWKRLLPEFLQAQQDPLLLQDPRVQRAGRAPLSDGELAGLAITMPDFEAAIKKVQPSVRREGFATTPDVTWEDVGALQEVNFLLTVHCSTGRSTAPVPAGCASRTEGVSLRSWQRGWSRAYKSIAENKHALCALSRSAPASNLECCRS